LVLGGRAFTSGEPAVWGLRSSPRATLEHPTYLLPTLLPPTPSSPTPHPRWDRKYWATYKVLDILQKVFYRSNPAREAFVELCDDAYVQKMTFDSYLYKTVVPGNPLDDVKLLYRTGEAAACPRGPWDLGLAGLPREDCRGRLGSDW
jgi:hypothetical protein